MFGRTGTDPWQIVRNRANSKDATITVVSATDLTDSQGNRYTNPKNNDHAWDVEGFDELVIGVENKWLPGYTDNFAHIQARMY